MSATDPPEPLSRAEQQVLAAEYKVELHTAELRKELRLPDLVLSQVLNIVGLAWIGTAGKLGSAHLMFWLAAIVFFYIPSALVVIRLNKEMPLEGGLYQWAKLRFSELAGFLVAWNLWIYGIVLLSELGLLATTNLAYALGTPALADNKAVIVTASVLITLLLMAAAYFGLALGRWIHGLSGFMLVALFATVVALAIPKWAIAGAAHPPLSLALPAFSLLNLNLLGKMGFGALGGYDTVAIFAGECRAADSSALIRRSVWLATPLVTGAFILGTASVLVFLKPESIDLIAPLTQTLSRSMEFAGISGPVVTVGIALIVLTRLGQGLLIFNATVRLPMVAGWDHLLPQWFTRLHPKYRTPLGSIAAIGGSVLGMASLANLGARNQEAYQLLQNCAGIFYALTYLVMFAIPFVLPGASPWLRIVSASGFLMTLLYVILSVFPIIDVANRALFTAKISGVLMAFNLAGVLFYWRAGGFAKRPLQSGW